MKQTKAIDFCSGEWISRPKENSRLRYDFDFKKKDSQRWLYLNSFNDFTHKLVKKQIEETINNGGDYRIVEASTGKVVNASRTKYLRI